MDVMKSLPDRLSHKQREGEEENPPFPDKQRVRQSTSSSSVEARNKAVGGLLWWLMPTNSALGRLKQELF